MYLASLFVLCLFLVVVSEGAFIREPLTNVVEAVAEKSVSEAGASYDGLSETKAKVSPGMVNLRHGGTREKTALDCSDLQDVLSQGLKAMPPLAKFVGISVTGTTYRPANGGAAIVPPNKLQEFYKLASSTEKQLRKCSRALESADKHRKNDWLTQWVGGTLSANEFNRAKATVEGRGASFAPTKFDADKSAQSVIASVRAESKKLDCIRLQVALDVCVSEGANLSPWASSRGVSPSALRDLEILKAMFVPKKTRDNIKALLGDLKLDVDVEEKQLRERTRELEHHKEVNAREQHEQYLDRLELDDDLDLLSKRKEDNLLKVTKRLAQLHQERGRPCSGARCETLRRIVGALRRAKTTLSNADECNAAKDCTSCTAMVECGWCATEQTCLEGNGLRPRFGPACRLSWIHRKGEYNQCPKETDTAPTTPSKYPDPSILFDPECATFEGSPGDCERAKLRMSAIEHMCLAKGNTEEECEAVKLVEAKKIYDDQLRKAALRKDTLSTLKEQARAVTDEKIRKCREQTGNFALRFADCIELKSRFGVANAFLEISDDGATGAATEGTTGAATGGTTGAAATGSELVTQDMKAEEEKVAKEEAAKEKEEKEAMAKLQADDEAAAKYAAAKALAKRKAELALISATGSTGATGATGISGGGSKIGTTGATGGKSVVVKTTSLGTTSIGQAATGPSAENAKKDDLIDEAIELKKINERNAATILGDNVASDGGVATSATISIELRMKGVSMDGLKKNAYAFAEAVAIAWSGDKRLASDVQLLGLHYVPSSDNGIAAAAALDAFLDLGGNSSSNVDAPGPIVDVPEPRNKDSSIEFKVLFTLHGKGAFARALQIANEVGDEQRAVGKLSSLLPEKFASVVIKVISKPKVIAGNTQSKKALASAKIDAATREMQEALARHTVKILDGSMWSHHRPHADPRIQQLYVKRFACRDDDCLKRYDDQISAHKLQNSDAVDTEQIEGGSSGFGLF
jgi:hypothetical protein